MRTVMVAKLEELKPAVEAHSAPRPPCTGRHRAALSGILQAQAELSRTPGSEVGRPLGGCLRLRGHRAPRPRTSGRRSPGERCTGLQGRLRGVEKAPKRLSGVPVSLHMDCSVLRPDL